MESSYELIIRNAKTLESRALVDVAINQGAIKKVAPEILGRGSKIIDAGGRFLSPGFVDLHMHLDKAWMGDEDKWQCLTLLDSIESAIKIRSAGWDKDEITQRARRGLEIAIRKGTTMLRTHVDLSEQTDLAGIEAILALREKVKPWVDIQIVAFLGEGYSTTKDGGEKLLRQAMKMGADVVGAATLSDADPSRHLDMLFKVAKDYNAEIDLHADETNDPEQSAVEIFAEKAIRHGWIGRVTGSHVCSLYWQSESVAQHVINKIKQAKMRIVTNPITNLYIHGKDPRLPTGPTRVQELLDNGVVVGMGTDNTRDVFSPAGNADMLLAALLLIYQRRILKPPILETALNMATKWGASIMKPAVSYGVHNGCQADLVLFDAYSLDEVITDLPQRCYVLKKGKITVEQNKLVEPLP